jgi:hypothetical protein
MKLLLFMNNSKWQYYYCFINLTSNNIYTYTKADTIIIDSLLYIFVGWCKYETLQNRKLRFR